MKRENASIKIEKEGFVQRNQLNRSIVEKCFHGSKDDEAAGKTTPPGETDNSSDSDVFNENIDFTRLLTISQTSIILVIWKPLEVTACMLSSYWYGYLSVFGGQYEEIHTASIFFELAFLFGMCINMMKQYTPDGETIAIKNLA